MEFLAHLRHAREEPGLRPRLFRVLEVRLLGIEAERAGPVDEQPTGTRAAASGGEPTQKGPRRAERRRRFPPTSSDFSCQLCKADLGPPSSSRRDWNRRDGVSCQNDGSVNRAAPAVAPAPPAVPAAWARSGPAPGISPATCAVKRPCSRRSRRGPRRLRRWSVVGRCR